MTKFRVLTTPTFEKEAGKLVRQQPKLASVLPKFVKILEEDPYNYSRHRSGTQVFS